MRIKTIQHIWSHTHLISSITSNRRIHYLLGGFQQFLAKWFGRKWESLGINKTSGLFRGSTSGNGKPSWSQKTVMFSRMPVRLLDPICHSFSFVGSWWNVTTLLGRLPAVARALRAAKCSAIWASMSYWKFDQTLGEVQKGKCYPKALSKGWYSNYCGHVGCTIVDLNCNITIVNVGC